MESKANFLKEIKLRTGRKLEAEQWNKVELANLFRLAKEGPAVVQTPTQISGLLLPFASRRDPRLADSSYMRNIYESPVRDERLQDLGLVHRKLNLVIALEGTLVSSCEERPGMIENLAIDRTIQESTARIIRCPLSDSSTCLLVAERPYASDFLKRLKSIGNLYLISATPYKRVRAILSQLHWTDLFEDLYAEARPKSINTCFPRLLDPQQRGLTLILDDKMNDWEKDDQMYVIPALRFMALERFQAIESAALVYYFTSEIYINGSFTPDAFNFFEADPGSPQLQNIEKKLGRVAFELFLNQYKCDARAVFFRCQKQKVTVDISDVKRREAISTIARLVGRQVVDRDADVTIVDNNRMALERGDRFESVNALIQAYFNIGTR